MEFKINQKDFKDIFKSLRMSKKFQNDDVVRTCYVVIDKDGIKLTGMNMNNTALISINIPTTTFTEYEYDLPTQYKFVFEDLDSIETMIGLFKSSPYVLIYLDEGNEANEKSIRLCFEDEDNVKYFSFPVDDSDWRNFDGLYFDDAMRVKFNLKDFKNFIKPIKKKDEKEPLKFQVDTNKLIISRNGNELVQNINEIDTYYENYYNYPLMDAVRNVKADECFLLLKPDYPIGIDADLKTHSIHIVVAPYLID